MRKQFLALLMSLLAMGFITAAAQTQGASMENSTPAALRSVNVVRIDDGVSIEIDAHGAVKPHLRSLDNPARVVVDLPKDIHPWLKLEHGEVRVNRAWLEAKYSRKV